MTQLSHPFFFRYPSIDSHALIFSSQAAFCVSDRDLWQATILVWYIEALLKDHIAPRELRHSYVDIFPPTGVRGFTTLRVILNLNNCSST